MCTVVWGTHAVEQWVCFNRDEQRNRAEAELPELHDGPNGPLAYARDPDGGGTWFAVAANGFAIALLNHYPAAEETPERGARSRGLLVVDLAGQKSVTEAIRHLKSADHSLYSPFHVFIFSMGMVNGYSWNGRTLTEKDASKAFCTTSSYRPAEVFHWREQQWQELSGKNIEDPARAAELLRRRHGPDGAFGFTMDRDDARTQSQIILKLREDGFTFQYRVRDPDGLGYLPAQTVNYPVAPL